MNERIKKIGKTAGFAFIEDSVYGQRWYSGKCGMDAEEFEKFAELIAQYEREACAKVCDEYDVAEDVNTCDTAEGIAIAIRARGQA